MWQDLDYTYLNGKEYSYYRHVILTAGNHYSIVGVTTTKTRFYVFDIHKFTFYKEMFLAIQHHYSAVISYNTNYSVIFLYPARFRYGTYRGCCSKRDGARTSINPYPTAFPYGNGMVLHFYQQQESSTTKTVHKIINKGLKAYV